MPETCVIIPGILGTPLNARLGGQRVRVWPALEVLASEGPGVMQLAPDGVSPGPLASLGALTPSEFILNDIYGPLVQRVTELKYVTRAWGYDWRKPIPLLGQQLADALPDLVGDTDYRIVAHSMGGLVARVAYAALGDTPLRSRWKRTVTLGTPHGGSYAAVSNIAGDLGTWNLLGTFLSGVFAVNTFNPLAVGPFRSSFMNLLLQTLASWPGLFELMPSRYGPWQNSDPLASRLWTEANWTAGGVQPWVTQSHLDAAGSDIQAMTGLLTGAQPATVTVLSTLWPTSQRLAGAGPFNDPRTFVSAIPGDGTVTLERGTLAGGSVVKSPASHVSYATNGPTLRELGNLLAGQVPELIPQVRDEGREFAIPSRDPVRPPPPFAAVDRRNDP